MSDISNDLNKILSAIYGKDMRQAIHDAIKQCNLDVNNPDLKELALQEAVQEKIDDGTISALTLADGAVTEDKLSEDLLEQIDSTKYITGADGNKYTLSVDEDGNIVAKPYYDLPKDGLVLDIRAHGSRVVEGVHKKILTGFTANDDGTFYGDSEIPYDGPKGTDLLDGIDPLTNRTLIYYANLEGKLRAGFYQTTIYDIGFNVGDNIVPVNHVYNDVLGSDRLNIAVYDYPRISNTKVVFEDPSHAFYGASFDYDNQKICGVVYDGECDWATANRSTKLSALRYIKDAKTYRIMLYNRALSLEELRHIRSYFNLTYSDYKISKLFAQGLTRLGSSSAFKNRSKSWNEAPTRIATSVASGEQTYTENGESRTFTNIDWQEPVVDDVSSEITDLLWTNPIDSLTTDQIYKIEAFPYPYFISYDKSYIYNVEYSTSDSSVIECYNGVLIPKKAGTATITAKLSGTEITTTKEITVTAPAEVVKKYFHVGKDYSCDEGSFSKDSPEGTLKAIIYAINYASENGYNGIVFPKMDYYVKPFQSGIQCLVPSDFVIDFSNASMYCLDSDYCKDSDGGNYTIFSFGDHGTNGSHYMPCKNSYVQNLKYYGERYQGTNADSYYSPGCLFAGFSCGGTENCHIKNIRFEKTTGFHIATGQCGFDVWQGTSVPANVGLDVSGTARRGCTLPSDYQAGRLASDGVTIQEDSTGMWYCTPEMMILGFKYAKVPAKSPEMYYYTVGAMGAATRPGSKGYWYELFFFDKDKKLIQATGPQMSLERYILPEGAVYFKINLAAWEQPAKQSQVDVEHVVRLWAVGDPYQCYIENCQFFDPECSAVSWVGGYDCVMRDCYAEQGQPVSLKSGRYGWSIDYEDGWLEMRHNIMYNSLCSGLVANPGGWDTAYLSDCINSLSATGSAQGQLNVINSTVQTISCAVKWNDYYNNVTYTSMKTPVSGDIKSDGRARIVNCTHVDNLGLFM